MYPSPTCVSPASYRPTEYGAPMQSREDDAILYLDDHRSTPTSPLHQNTSFLHYHHLPSPSPNQVRRPHPTSPLSSPLAFHHSPASTRVMLFPAITNSPSNLTGLSQPSTEDFDILSFLPPEISIKILLCLQPEDLCMADQVCVRWHQLAQYGKVEQRRKKFVEDKRVEYQKSKENYAPATTTAINGGVGLSPSAMTVSPGGPLSAIQPLNSPSPRVTSPTRFTWTDTSNLHLLNSRHQQNQPSSPTYFLVEDVNRLSLDDKHHHRTIFGSEGLASPLPAAIRKGLPVNLPSLRHAVKEVVGKKVNKSRLRRL